MRMKLLTLLLLALLAAPAASACGLVTHAVMANRALHAYALDPAAPALDLIRKHADAFYSGAIFPDWGFVPSPTGGKAIHHDAAEEAHWTPFMKVAAAYVRSKPRPWDTATERLAVFLLGALVHDSTDVSWHNIGCNGSSAPADPLGFLQAMANADFTKNDSSFHGIDTPVPPPPPGKRTAHNIGDTGGDPLCAYRYSLSFLPETVWFPADDLVEIYRRHDPKLNVTKEQLRAAMEVQQAYLNFYRSAESAGAIRELIEESFVPYVASWSPFLIEHFEDYYAGGVDEGAVVSMLRWPVLLQWFEKEPSGFPARDDLLCVGGGGVTEPLTSAYPAATLPDFGTPDEQKAEAALLREVAQRRESNSAVSSDTSAANAYAYAGTAVAASRGNRRGGATARGDFNRDGIDDLVVGAPGTSWAKHPSAGAVSIYFGRAGGEAMPRDPDVVVQAPDSFSRFGAAVAVVDLNGDGLDDLVVGAPWYGNATGASRARGRVYVYFGRKEGGISPAPDAVIEGPHGFASFGALLVAADCNGDGLDDLIVGSPYAGTPRQSGNVSVWLARASIGRGTLGAPDWTAGGEKAADRFGSAAAVVHRDGKAILVAGAPGAKRDDFQESGKIYGYDLTGIGGAPIVNPRPLFTVAASERFAHFGASLAAGAPRDGKSELLAVGAPTADRQNGFVVVLPPAVLNGDLTLASLTPELRIAGEQALSRFGWSIAFADLDGDGIDELVVSEPMRVIAKKVDSGMVYAWRGGTTFPRGTIRASQATWKAAGDVRRAQFGRALCALDARNPSAKPKLAIASPFDATAAPLAGSVVLRTMQ